MAGKVIKLSRRQAANLHWNKQLLSGSGLPKGKAGVRQVIECLGYVQIDTISVIERSHHLVLFTRCPDYQPDYLNELLWPDRQVFEYWAHAASYIPISDYRYYLPAIRRTPKPGSWFEKWSRGNQAVIKKVRRRIEREGPLSATDFPDDTKRKRGPWWDWKPEKAALEVLFWRGELMIRERRKFQRVYDLTGRVLPVGLDLTRPDEKEEKEFFIRRAIGSLGLATVQDINRYIGVAGRLNDRLAALVRDGDISEVAIEGSDRLYYMLAKDRGVKEDKNLAMDKRVRFLSPFDNSIILRDRTQRLFEFSCTLECYVPPAKRKFGYFCLPILWRGDLVGRIDPKADRKKRRFIVNNLHLEKKGLDRTLFASAFAQTLKDFANFHNCPEIQITKQVPSRLVKMISRYL
jgi:uncharacterized protein YcaQ